MSIDSYLQNSEKSHNNGIDGGVHDEEFKKDRWVEGTTWCVDGVVTKSESWMYNEEEN